MNSESKSIRMIVFGHGRQDFHWNEKKIRKMWTGEALDPVL